MIRIIAGHAKGTQLTTSHCGTRPAGDRVREVLFSTLVTQFGIVGESVEKHLARATVLDLYTGTEAITLETASWGVSRVVAVDSYVSNLIAGNTRRARLCTEARGGRVKGRIPARSWGPILVDPPCKMDSTLLDGTLALPLSPGKLDPQALVIVERLGRRLPPV